MATHPISNWGLRSNGSACNNSNDGFLQPNEQGDGFINIVHDPWRPVPAIGGHLGTEPGNADRATLDMRSDVAVFTSPPIEKSLHLEGIPHLNLLVQADKNGFDLCVALSIISQDQTKVTQVSTGNLRVLGYQAKENIPREVVLQAMLADLKKGEKLRISIAGSAWPAIGINPGDERYPCGASGPHSNVITMALNLSDSNFHVLPLIG